MDFETWKAALITEIETAADERAERALGGVDLPGLKQSQKELFGLAEQVKALPADHQPLRALFNEEGELARVQRANPGEPQSRYHEAKEELLQAYGLDHPPFASVDAFLEVLRHHVDETLSEFRLRV